MPQNKIGCDFCKIIAYFIVYQGIVAAKWRKMYGILNAETKPSEKSVAPICTIIISFSKSVINIFANKHYILHQGENKYRNNIFDVLINVNNHALTTIII